MAGPLKMAFSDRPANQSFCALLVISHLFAFIVFTFTQFPTEIWSEIE